MRHEDLHAAPQSVYSVVKHCFTLNTLHEFGPYKYQSNRVNNIMKIIIIIMLEHFLKQQMPCFTLLCNHMITGISLFHEHLAAQMTSLKAMRTEEYQCGQ
jgi:hypothetical protein